MSTNYIYDFISPQTLYAEVKEDFSSYFNTGVDDDTMFPIYTSKYLDRLGRGSYGIDWAILPLDCSQANTPDDFWKVRELWAITTAGYHYDLPSAIYSAKTCRVISDWGDFDPCNPCDRCDPCIQEQQLLYKTHETAYFKFSFSHLLKPGNIHAKEFCHQDSPNISTSSLDTFDVRDKKIITNFPAGTLYLTYYKKETDEEGNPLIPDNHFIKEGLIAYLKYKTFEKLRNSVTDETANQIELKYQDYKNDYYSFLSRAEVETKKQTVEQKIQAIQYNNRRLNRYKIR